MTKYRVAKSSPMQNIAVTQLISHFKAPGFLHQLQKFMWQAHRRKELTVLQYPSQYDYFHLYKSASLDICTGMQNGQSFRPISDHVRCLPGPQEGSLRKQDLGPHKMFSTVMVREPSCEFVLPFFDLSLVLIYGHHS